MGKDSKDFGLGGGQFGRIVLALLALSIFINYIDRGNLATAAPLIRSDLQLTNVEYGLLVSAFFWAYVPGQIIAAWLVQRINPYRTLSIGLAIWSTTTVASGFANGFAMLLLFRVLLGIGESAGFPRVRNCWRSICPSSDWERPMGW
jgi:MFS family permease